MHGMSKGKLAAVTILASMIFAGAFTAALASGSISVEEIAPVYVERGDQNCLVTMKAHVTNHGEAGNISVEVVGVDAEGYQLQTVKLSGPIKSGTTKVLLERVQMQTAIYDKVVSWELLK